MRPIRRAQTAGRDPDKARRVAAELATELSLPVDATPDLATAVRDGDVACATTHSPEPVVRRASLSPATHVTSVGYKPEGRQVDAVTVVDALVVVDLRHSALTPPPAGSNDLLWPLRDGSSHPNTSTPRPASLVAGTATGRTSPEQITLSKSVGVAVQDATTGALVLEAASQHGVGAQVEV